MQNCFFNILENNHMKKVSIIIPVYNVEAYIEDCITSVMAQDYEQLEVLIVDDCTPDQSISIVEKMISGYEGPHTYRIIRHAKNGGQSAARNSGISEATGELIYFLDSDDYICEKAISNLVELYIETHANIVIGNLKIVDYQTKEVIRDSIQLSSSYYFFSSLKDLYACHDVIRMGVNGVPWNKLIEKDFLLKNKLLFDLGIIFEDDIWNYKVYCCKPKIAVSSSLTYIYRMRPSSIMTTFTEHHFYSSVKCADIAILYGHHVQQSSDHWFVINGIERYIIGALYKSFDKVKSKDTYSRLYRRYRKKHRPSFELWSNLHVPLATKVKSLHYLLPCILGEKLLLCFLKRQQKIMRKLYPHQAALPTIELSDSFWSKIE